MESPGLVSVIVSFLNGSNWLLEALESVLQQTYPFWELIVIDDGSELEHSAVAKAFCDKHTGRTFYTEHEGHINRGLTISRNEAIKLARGNYIAFLDADDKWLPGKLLRQMAVFSAHPEVQVVCNATIMWYSWRDKQEADYPEYIGAPPGKIYPPNTLNKLLYPFRAAASPAPSGMIVRKEAFDRIQGFVPEFSGIYELYEDQAFLSKIYLHETVYISADADIFYRKRNDSMSSAANNPKRYRTVRAFYLNWLENYLLQNEIRDEELFRLINTARKEMNLLPEPVR